MSDTISKNLNREAVSNENESLCYSLPDLRPGEIITVLFHDKATGVKSYRRAFIVKKVPTKDNEMQKYLISYGKKRMRETLPLTRIHAAALEGTVIV